MTKLGVWLAGSALLLAACGGGGGGGGNNNDMSTGPSIDQACTDDATAICAKLAACRPMGIEDAWGDMATCVARRKLRCTVSRGAPSTGQTAAKIEACANAIAGATCADYFDNNIPACQTTFGALATGAACSWDSQCQTGFCGYAPGAACGHCAPLPNAGDSCAMLDCGPHKYCDAKSICRNMGKTGDACAASTECVYGLACVGVTNNTDGTCQPAATMTGAACDRTKGPLCEYLSSLFCSFAPMSTAGTCQPYQYASVGQACGSTAQVVTLCLGTTTCTNKVCVALAADGAACDTKAGPFCLNPARCVTGGNGTAGTCQVPDAGMCK